MYYFAICDCSDRSATSASIKAMTTAFHNHCHCDFRVEFFESFQKILDEIGRGQIFDLILLSSDIVGGKIMQAKQKLYEHGFGGLIIVVSSSTECALEAFKANAVHYLLTPISQSELFAALERAVTILESERHRYIAIRADGKLRRIAICDIIYSEAQNQYQYMYLTDGSELRVRSTRAELFEQIGDYSSFVRVGGAYIINLIHAQSISSKAVDLDNGQMLWLPRGSYGGLKERYNNFYRCLKQNQTVGRNF